MNGFHIGCTTNRRDLFLPDVHAPRRARQEIRRAGKNATSTGLHLYGGNEFTALPEYVPLLRKFRLGGAPGPEGRGRPIST